MKKVLLNCINLQNIGRQSVCPGELRCFLIRIAPIWLILSCLMYLGCRWDAFRSALAVLAMAGCGAFILAFTIGSLGVLRMNRRGGEIGESVWWKIFGILFVACAVMCVLGVCSLTALGIDVAAGLGRSLF